jgi:protein TonB
VASPLECAPGVGGGDLKRRVVDIARTAVLSKRLHAAKKATLTAAAGLALTIPIAVGVLSGNLAFGQEERGASTTTEREDSLPIVRVAPEYPEAALAAALEGEVTLEFTITTDGTTADVRAVDSSSPVFEEAAVDALRKWRYAPVMRDDRPFELRGVQTVIRFRLQRGERPEEPALGAALPSSEGDTA